MTRWRAAVLATAFVIAAPAGRPGAQTGRDAAMSAIRAVYDRESVALSARDAEGAFAGDTDATIYEETDGATATHAEQVARIRAAFAGPLVGLKATVSFVDVAGEDAGQITVTTVTDATARIRPADMAMRTLLAAAGVTTLTMRLRDASVEDWTLTPRGWRRARSVQIAGSQDLDPEFARLLVARTKARTAPEGAAMELRLMRCVGARPAATGVGASYLVVLPDC